MRITVGHVYSQVLTKDARALAIVKSVCRARPDGFQFMPKYVDGHWDGYISLMPTMHSFPTGLMHMVIPALTERGYQPEIDLGDYSKNRHVPVDEISLKGIVLRDYQKEAVQKLVEAQRGIAKMATNSGKTEVIAGILKSLPGRRALVLLHRKELLHQTADRLVARGISKVGKIGDDTNNPDRVTVAMIQTLSGMDSHAIFSNNQILIVDECHHASSNQMMDVLAKIQGKYRYGFSGTPLKEDMLADMKLISMTGEVIVDVSNADLIDEGHSAKPVIYLHDIQYDDDWELDYQTAYSEFIVNSIERNALIASISNMNRDRVVLILVTRIEHGEKLRKLIPGAIFVHGNESSEQRQDVLNQMRSGLPGTYIASTIFDEGVDVPDIHVLILAGGGKSSIKVLQRIGRGLRKKDGENVLEVHDFIDDANTYLLDHSEARIDVYLSEGFEVITEATAG